MQRWQQLPLRQIAGCAEDNDDGWRHRDLGGLLDRCQFDSPVRRNGPIFPPAVRW